jgi:glycine/D-amino acid oxidase-like deaminating enzyme
MYTCLTDPAQIAPVDQDHTPGAIDCRWKIVTMPAMSMPPCPHVKVAIVGGGVAGITLALAFERLGIDYALLEAQDSLAPELGASVGLLPNGQRILDQLGLLDEIEQHTISLRTWRHLDQNGELISTVDAMSHYETWYVRISSLSLHSAY